MGVFSFLRPPSDIVNLLGMKPLPVEGGMMVQTWMDEHSSAICIY